MTSLYETWLTANPKMATDSSRWKIFVESNPDIESNPSARWEQFQEYQRIHFLELWKLQNSQPKIAVFADNSQEQKTPRKRNRV